MNETIQPETLPDWSALSDHDKAQVVLFLRTAEDEGLAYAQENYAPEWAAGSALAVSGDGRWLRARYNDDYRAMAYGDEFWRLYRLATDGAR